MSTPHDENNENEDDFFGFDLPQTHMDDENPQLDFWGIFEQFDPIELWPPSDPCKLCHIQEGFHYAEVDRLLFLCDDCYNDNFSIDHKLAIIQ